MDDLTQKSSVTSGANKFAKIFEEDVYDLKGDRANFEEIYVYAGW